MSGPPPPWFNAPGMYWLVAPDRSRWCYIPANNELARFVTLDGGISWNVPVDAEIRPYFTLQANGLYRDNFRGVNDRTPQQVVAIIEHIRANNPDRSTGILPGAPPPYPPLPDGPPPSYKDAKSPSGPGSLARPTYNTSVTSKVGVQPLPVAGMQAVAVGGQGHYAQGAGHLAPAHAPQPAAQGAGHLAPAYTPQAAAQDLGRWHRMAAALYRQEAVQHDPNDPPPGYDQIVRVDEDGDATHLQQLVWDWAWHIARDRPDLSLIVARLAARAGFPAVWTSLTTIIRYHHHYYAIGNPPPVDED